MSTSSPECVEDLSRRSGELVAEAVWVQQETRLKLLDGGDQTVEARKKLNLRRHILCDLCTLGEGHKVMNKVALLPEIYLNQTRAEIRTQ